MAKSAFRKVGDDFFSYETIIVQCVGGKYIVNETYYSRTTSKHLHKALREIPFGRHAVVTGVPFKTTNLVPFLTELQAEAI